MQLTHFPTHTHQGGCGVGLPEKQQGDEGDTCGPHAPAARRAPPSGAHRSEAWRQNGHSVLWDYKGLVWLPAEWGGVRGWGHGLCSVGLSLGR